MNAVVEQPSRTVLECTPAQAKVEGLIDAMKGLPTVYDVPTVHRFTPGLYTREAQAVRGTLVVTKIHKTEHPFVLLSGKCAVWDEKIGVVRIQAPYIGITKPGTRRVIYVLEDCSWLTFHVTDRTNPDEIVDAFTFDRYTDDMEYVAPKTLEEMKRV